MGNNWSNVMRNNWSTMSSISGCNSSRWSSYNSAVMFVGRGVSNYSSWSTMVYNGSSMVYNWSSVVYNWSSMVYNWSNVCVYWGGMSYNSWMLFMYNLSTWSGGGDYTTFWSNNSGNTARFSISEAIISNK